MDKNQSVAIQQEEDEGALKKALKVIVFPFSALMGYLFAAPIIENAAYDNLRHRGVLDKINKQHKEKMDVLFTEFQEGKPVNLLEDAKHLRGLHQERVASRFQEFGLGSLSKKWQFIHKSQRNDALMAAFTAAGVSIGALFSIANSKAVHHALSSQDEPNKENERQ